MQGRQSRVQSTGKGRGRRGDFGLGPGGECVCPICKHSMPHKIGNPCNDHRCPQCGTIMERGATVSNDI